MVSKDYVRSRLQGMRILDGVLPTGAAPSAETGRIAEGLRSSDVESAAAASRRQLSALPQAEESAFEAASELYSDDTLRDQLAGFADAGINFFNAGADFQRLPSAARTTRGGHEQVSRVMVDNARILLETSRLVIRFSGDMAPEMREKFLVPFGIRAIGGAGMPPDTIRADAGGRPALDVCMKLLEQPWVVYAEPDFIEHIGTRYTPGDPEFGQQWHHVNIDAQTAWDQTTGQGVRIAVIDNGFATAHPDLRFGDASGYFRSSSDFVDADFIAGLAGMPVRNHGTACAGMIAAVADNGVGGCGVAFGADLSMISCLNDQVGTQATLARALAYAADPSLEGHTVAGADIIACSLGPNIADWAMSAVLEDAIDFAAAQGRGGKGCPIFWASTNGDFPISADKVCSHPQVMAIGRSTVQDEHNNSGFGPELEFLAPGVDVWIPSSNGGYHTTMGTSFAAPCAAGIGALALSQKPDMTAAELRQLMRDTCDKVGPMPYTDGRNDRYGHGRANAASAVAEARRLATGV